MIKCSAITFRGSIFCILARLKLRTLKASNPQTTLAKIAIESLNNKTGIIKVRAKRNLARKVESVDCHISLVVCLFSDSSEIWMPRASEKASAMAIVKIPPMTASFEEVAEFNPTINPRVVIIPEVTPKLSPVLIGWFITNSLTNFTHHFNPYKYLAFLCLTFVC